MFVGRSVKEEVEQESQVLNSCDVLILGSVKWMDNGVETVS